MIIYEDCVNRAGLNLKEVERIARRLNRVAKDAEKLGLHIFGGSNSGSLRYDDGHAYDKGCLIVAHLHSNFDGGDGSCTEDDEGLMRGE